MKSLCDALDVPLNICLCFQRSRRQENATTHGSGERVAGHHRYYKARCVVWKILQMAGIEMAAENELSAAILFVLHVSLPEAV